MDGSIGYVDRVNMMQGGPLRVCKTAIARINGLAQAHDFKPGMLTRMAAQGDGRNRQCRGQQRQKEQPEHDHIPEYTTPKVG